VPNLRRPECELARRHANRQDVSSRAVVAKQNGTVSRCGEARRPRRGLRRMRPMALTAVHEFGASAAPVTGARPAKGLCPVLDGASALEDI